MKKVFFMITFIVMQFFTSCFYFGADDDDFLIDPYGSSYEPVVLSRTEFENSIQLKEPESISVSGKIYVKGNLLFINELRMGFHIYDNTDPSNPLPLRFISVPGSTDLAIRNNTFYINQATDLIAINFDSTFQEIKVSKRIKDVFPTLISPDGFYHNSTSQEEVVVDWTLQTKKLSKR